MEPNVYYNPPYVTDKELAEIGSPVVVMAVYEDGAVGASGAPSLVLVDGDADGAVVELAEDSSAISILVDGTYAVSLLGNVYGSGTTGGNVTLQVPTPVQAVNTSGAATSGEFDATVSVTMPMSEGDTITPHLSAVGAAVEGFIRLVITKIA